MTFKPITFLLLFLTIFTGIFQPMVGVGGLEARASPQDVSYETNSDGDNIYSQFHCLPDNIPSGTPIEFSIHIVDKAGNYRYNGSWGNQWKMMVIRDNVAPTGRIETTDYNHTSVLFPNIVGVLVSAKDETNGSGMDKVETLVAEVREGKKNNIYSVACSNLWTDRYICNHWLDPFNTPDQQLQYISKGYDKAGNSGIFYKPDGTQLNVNYEANAIWHLIKAGLIVTGEISLSTFRLGKAIINGKDAGECIYGISKTYQNGQPDEYLLSCAGLIISNVSSGALNEVIEIGGKRFKAIIQPFTNKGTSTFQKPNNHSQY